MALGRWRRGFPTRRGTPARPRVQKARRCGHLARRVRMRRRRHRGALRRARAMPSRAVHLKQSLCGPRRALPGRPQPRQPRPATSRRQRRRFRRGRCKNRRLRGRLQRRRHRTAVQPGWRRFLASSTRRSASRATTRLRRSGPRQPVRPRQRPAGLFHLVNLTILLSHAAREAPRRPLLRLAQPRLPAPPADRRPTSPQTTPLPAVAGRQPGSTAWIPPGNAQRAGPMWTPRAALQGSLPPNLQQ